MGGNGGGDLGFGALECGVTGFEIFRVKDG
jgi:hypothetical protein